MVSYGEDLIFTCPALMHHPLFAVHDCLFSVLIATVYLEVVSSDHVLKMCKTKYVILAPTEKVKNIFS
jgi:hypothetical protein